MDPSGVSRHLRERHMETLTRVTDCLDAVAGDLEQPADREVVVTRLEMALRESELLEPLVDVLESAMAAADAEPEADPVAASPYVVVTARGPMLRASDGDRRLVVLFRGFERTGDGYRQADRLSLEVNVRE